MDNDRCWKCGDPLLGALCMKACPTNPPSLLGVANQVSKAVVEAYDHATPEVRAQFLRDMAKGFEEDRMEANRNRRRRQEELKRATQPPP